MLDTCRLSLRMVGTSSHRTTPVLTKTVAKLEVKWAWQLGYCRYFGRENDPSIRHLLQPSMAAAAFLFDWHQ